MQTIKMLVTDAGPSGCFPEGSTRTVGDDEAKLLIEGGYAVLVESIADGLVEAEADSGPVENASAAIDSSNAAEAAATGEPSQVDPETQPAPGGKPGGKRGRKK